MKLLITLLLLSSIIECSSAKNLRLKRNETNDESWGEEEYDPADDEDVPIIDTALVDEQISFDFAREYLFGGPSEQEQFIVLLQKTLDMYRAAKRDRTLRITKNSNSTSMEMAADSFRFATCKSLDELEQSSSSQSQCASSQDNFIVMPSPNRQTRAVSSSTMKKIVSLADNGRSEAAIKRLYPWYDRSYLNRYRKNVEEDDEIEPMERNK